MTSSPSNLLADGTATLTTPRVPSPAGSVEHAEFTLNAPYEFPTAKLKRRLTQPGKTPLCLVACGSYSPITFLHMRMFELAADFVKFQSNYELVGGYLSPVSDAYKKQGLAKAHHRVRMCQLAFDEVDWIMVDPYEALQQDYVPTANVLDHFEENLNAIGRGIETVDGKRTPIKIALLAGADLIHTMSTPGVWSPTDLDHILGRFGAFIIEREGTDTMEALSSLSRWADNINVIPQTIRNDISSTKVRLFRKRDMSIRWLLPDSVREYIERHGIYQEERKAEEDAREREKQKALETNVEAGSSSAGYGE